MDYLERVVNLIDSYSCLGQRILDNGTRLIGHAPHIAPEAWLHIVFPPLGSREVSFIEDDVGESLPATFSFFLQRCNGLSLFSDSLNIYGLRKSFARTGDSVWQPFSIKTPNVDERPRRSKPSYFYIGGYRWDGSLIFIDKDTEHVYRCKQRNTKPLNHWPSFEEMLESEARRLSDIFDRQGHPLNPEEPTTPKEQ